MVSWVTQVGAVELAFGALSGWVIALSVERPEVLRRRGVTSLPRLRQAHIDFILMGIILIALGTAAPGLPGFWQALLVAGAIVNPSLFLPLAFDPDASKRASYRVLTALSFVAMSSGTVAAAVHLLGR